jgi:tetratricopeptide (TPR) repeat protein
VAGLQLHLRDDTYRHDRARGADGQNVFAVALWRLERLQRSLGRTDGAPDNIGIVVEFARARALERLRRYSEARDAYERVASSGTVLAAVAEEAAAIMESFALESGGAPAGLDTPEAELGFLEERLKRWTELAFRQRGTLYAPLALEEAEAWSMLRVDWYARHRDPELAIEACERLIEAHRTSKLYPKHLIRLGDLYAETARRQVVRHRARRDPFDAGRYEHLVDSALAAYELAGDERESESRSEATNKIQALMSYHRGVRAHAP